MTVSPYTSWLSKVSESDVLVAALGSGGVVTVDMGGYVRLWETGSDTLQRSLMEWRNMIGSEDGRPVQVCCYVADRGTTGKCRAHPAVSLNATRGRCHSGNNYRARFFFFFPRLDISLHARSGAVYKLQEHS